MGCAPNLDTVIQIPQGSWHAIFWPVTPDPTGGTVRAQVRPRVTSDTVLHEWSTLLGTAEVTAEGVTLTTPSATSAEWEWRSGVFDLELTIDGETYRLDEGTVQVDPEVTR
jgi:hypothetical protein